MPMVEVGTEAGNQGDGGDNEFELRGEDITYSNPGLCYGQWGVYGLTHSSSSGGARLERIHQSEGCGTEASALTSVYKAGAAGGYLGGTLAV